MAVTVRRCAVVRPGWVRWVGLTGLVGCAATELDAEPVRPELATPHLRAQGSVLVDALDRQVILRGVNAGGSSKLPPFLPFPFAESGHPLQVDAPPFDDALAAYVDTVVGWGHNAVRLPFVWEAVEPARDAYDEVFLARYAAMAEAFGAAGMAVIVDAHQDVFGRHFCGSGAPDWAVAPGVPTVEGDCADWFTGYLSNPDVDEAFARLWNNEDGLMDAFLGAWEAVIDAVAGIEGVIAVEPMNEPHEGAVEEHRWVTEVMPSFWEAVAALAHARDPGLLVLLDTTGTDGIFGRTALRPPPGGHWVMAPHYYTPSVYLAGPERATWDVTAGLQPWADFGVEHDLPVLLGEFGSVTGSDAAARYLDDNWRALDAHLMHGTAWEYSTRLDDWNDEGFGFFAAGQPTPSVDVLPHVYPAAVSGRITDWRWDRSSGEGRLRFEAKPGVTEIVVPGARPEVSLGGAALRYAWDGMRLLITTRVGAAEVSLGGVAL